MENNIKILLDAGHYGKYNRSPVVKEYYESVVMWDLHLLLKEELEKYDFEVHTTRKDLYEDYSPFERGLKAKGFDVFLSLHSNGQKNGNTADRVEVYHLYDGGDDSFALAKGLAISVASIMGVSSGKVKTKESKDYPGTEFYGVLRGAKKAKCPLPFIIEHSFHTFEESARWLLDKENLRKLAKAEAVTIANFFGIETVEFVEGDVNGDGKLNTADYALAKKHVMGTRKLNEEEFERADINKDGKVNTADYVSIKKKVIDP